MKNSVKLNGFLLIIFTAVTILIYNCGSDSVTNTTTGPAAGTINGTITFVDTSKVQCTPTCGFYELAAFSSWPPAGPPNAYSTLTLTKANNVYTSAYSLVGLTGGGNYVLVAAYTELPYHPMGNFVLGIHGCDTSSSCYFVNPKHDTLPSSVGLANINFKAFIDTSDTNIKF